MKKFLAGFCLFFNVALTVAQTGVQFPDEMIAASLVGDEAKVLEIRNRADAADKPQRGDRKAARTLNAAGLTEISGGNFDAAIDLFTKATKADSLDAEIPSNLGYAYLKNRQYSQAQEALAQSINLQPGRGSAWATLAEVFARSGEVQTATACFNIAYSFSQNREKTKEFFSKILVENADVNLVAAAKMALETEGIKPLTKVEVPVPASQAETNSNPVQQAPSTSTQESSATPQVTTPPQAPIETLRPVAEQGNNHRESNSGTGSESRYLVSGVVLFVLIALGWFGYRKVTSKNSRADLAVSSGGASVARRPLLKQALIGTVILGVGATGGFYFLTGDKKIEVSRTNLQETFWNCSVKNESQILAFPDEASVAAGKSGSIIINTKTPQNSILQVVIPFDYSLDGNALSVTSRGGVQRIREPDSNQFTNISGDERRTHFRGEIALLTNRGMIITMGNDYGWRSCNRIDPKKDSAIFANAEGATVERPGLPNLDKFLSAQKKQHAEEVATQQPERQKASLDYPQKMAELYESSRLGGPQCDMFSSLIRQAADQTGTPENVRVMQVKGYISSASEVGCIR